LGEMKEETSRSPSRLKSLFRVSIRYIGILFLLLSLNFLFKIGNEKADLRALAEEKRQGYVGVVIGKNLPQRNGKFLIETIDKGKISGQIHIGECSDCFYDNVSIGDTITKIKNQVLVIIKKQKGDTIQCVP
jgi:hypothetical protein